MKNSKAKMMFAMAAAVALIAPAAIAQCSGNKASSTQSSYHHGEEGAMEAIQTKSIVETAMTAGSFKTLVAAVQAAGLADVLQGDGPFTVFAPTDEAFAKLPDGTVSELLKPENKEKLQAILTYHVVPGRLTSAHVVGLESAKTVQGQAVDIQVSDGIVMVDNARVTKVDIEATNGVIHVIDSVILPKTM